MTEESPLKEFLSYLTLLLETGLDHDKIMSVAYGMLKNKYGQPEGVSHDDMRDSKIKTDLVDILAQAIPTQEPIQEPEYIPKQAKVTFTKK